ncbi:MAG: MOSC domain-containing protein YiiM [Paracoccaceae bacterium]
MISLAELTSRVACAGRVDSLWIRPARLLPPLRVDHVVLGFAGLQGDHARHGKRAVTLIQFEHLPVIAALAGRDAVTPEMLRRNIVVAGLNLSAWRGKTLQVGGAQIVITGPCAPCSRMEHALGHGAYNAMRGHGGWCAEVLLEGTVGRSDVVTPVVG